MDVHVGSLNDPKDFPGIAHALGHCLFLGVFPLQARLIPFQAPRNIVSGAKQFENHRDDQRQFKSYFNFLSFIRLNSFSVHNS